MRKLSIVSVAFFILCACAENSGSSPGGAAGPAPAPPVKDLAQMSLPDALRTKYNYVHLICRLWTKEAGPVVLTDSPNDTVYADLFQEPNFPKTITLQATAGAHSIKIQIQLSKMQLLANGGYENNYGANYSFTNSPSIAGRYAGGMTSPGPVTGSFNSNSMSLSENIPSQIVAQSGGPEHTTDYADCLLATEAKPAYVNEWKQNSAGQEPTCILGPMTTNPADCLIRRN